MTGSRGRTAAGRIGQAGATFVAVAALASCHPYRPPSNDVVFVSNEIKDVTVVDGATGRIEGELATGPRPRGMALSPDGRMLYVAASNANRIEAWDVASRKRVRLYPSGSDPERFAISGDGAHMYVANEDHGAISFIDLRDGHLEREVRVGPEPEGVGVSPNGKLVVATSETANLAHFIDAQSGKLLDSVPVGSRPRFVLFLRRGQQAWVSSEQRGTISVFDATTRRIVHTVDLTQSFDIDEPVQAIEMRATRDERRVFVAMGRSNRVAEIDPATYKVVRWFPTGTRTWGIGLSPDETRLYAASGLSGTMTIIDLVKNKVVRTVDLGGKPWGAIAARK
jgi:PQQ-dependent catabolism-associated beta-propeller protein